jgi:uncharacterized protein (DUF1330 family)
MKARSKIALVMVGSFALGAAAVQSLHAQATSPGYAIVEVNVTDKDGYTKEFLPLAVKEIEAGGGKYIVRGGNPVTLQGTPPASRVVVLQFASVDKAQSGGTLQAARALSPLGTNLQPPAPSQLKVRRRSMMRCSILRPRLSDVLRLAVARLFRIISPSSAALWKTLAWNSSRPRAERALVCGCEIRWR